MRERMDEKDECNMAKEMFAISRFTSHLNPTKFVYCPDKLKI